jgi:hypothetical protein
MHTFLRPVPFSGRCSCGRSAPRRAGQNPSSGNGLGGNRETPVNRAPLPGPAKKTTGRPAPSRSTLLPSPADTGDLKPGNRVKRREILGPYEGGVKQVRIRPPREGATVGTKGADGGALHCSIMRPARPEPTTPLRPRPGRHRRLYLLPPAACGGSCDMPNRFRPGSVDRR